MTQIPTYPKWQGLMLLVGLAIGVPGLMASPAISLFLDRGLETIIWFLVLAFGWALVSFSLWRAEKIYKIRKRYLERESGR